MNTNPEQAVRRGVEPIAGPQRLRPQRKFEILTKDFTSAEQVAPLRVVYGRNFVAGVQVTPIFGFRSEAVIQKMGK